MRIDKPERSIQTQIRLTEAEREAVEIAARKEGFSVSQWVRYAIRQQLKSQGIEIS